MGKKAFMLFLAFILLTISLSFFTYAQEYYADLTVDVQDDGLVKISGITNDPSLSPGTYEGFTSKKGIYWLLNLSSDKKFSDYILSVTLPDGSEFNYLKTNGRSRVSYDNGIKIVASGTDSLNLLVQYHISNSKKSLLSLWILLTITGIIILGLFSWKRFLKKIILKNRNEIKEEIKKENKKESEKEIEIKKEKNAVKESAKSSLKSNDYEKIRIIKKTLAESQEEIIDLLLEAGGELVQKQLQHRSGLPKATLSRNIDVLSRKGIILKQSRGMTNMIMLNRELKDK